MVQAERCEQLVAHAPDGIDAGKTIMVGLQLATSPLTYWKNAGDSGLPTQLQWTRLPACGGRHCWRTTDCHWLGNDGYEGTVLLPVPLTIAKTSNPPGCLATWSQALCQLAGLPAGCVPQEGNFVLRIPMRGSTAINAAF